MKRAPGLPAPRLPRDIVAALDELVVGQSDAKRELAVAIHEHYRRYEASQSEDGAIRLGDELVEVEKSNVLMLGPSGTGKSLLARAVARMVQAPFYAADATRLTQAGYIGDDVETLLQGLLADAHQDIESAQWGICFIDEFDKLARKTGRSSSGYRDVTGEGVQQALLKMLEGTIVSLPRGRGSQSNLKVDIDTTNILFICAGSFQGIEDVVEARLSKSSRMGFGAERRLTRDADQLIELTTEEDLEQFGFLPEILGRLPVKTMTHPLTEDELVEILRTPKNAICKQFQALFSLDGIDLQFDEGALRLLARQALRRETGARALRSLVRRVIAPHSYSAPHDSDIVSIRITEEAVDNPERAVVVRLADTKRRRHTSSK